MMKDYEGDTIEQEGEIRGHIDSILNIVKKRLPNYKFKKILEYTGDCSYTYNYAIVNKSKITGEKQKENYWFKYVYIKQWTEEAHSNYHGIIYIPIGRRDFLKFEYSC